MQADMVVRVAVTGAPMEPSVAVTLAAQLVGTVAPAAMVSQVPTPPLKHQPQPTLVATANTRLSSMNIVRFSRPY